MTSGLLRPMWLSGVVLGQPLLDMWITCFHPFLHSTRNPKGKKVRVFFLDSQMCLNCVCVSTYRLNRYI